MVEGTSGHLNPRLVAVGGGKGGVGKSVLSVGLAWSLASRGHSCVLIDADLGAANAHTLLGMEMPKRTLGDLFNRQVEDLTELLEPTVHPNLKLISGAHGMLEVANLHYAQKLKLIRKLGDLQSEFIILDLGAGTSFNVLDFFLAADIGLTVSQPTPTSIENLYHFLKAAYFRIYKRSLRLASTAGIAAEMLEHLQQQAYRSPGDLLAKAHELDANLGSYLDRALSGFAPRLILNQVRRSEEKQLGEQMAIACQDFFGLPVSFMGAVQRDDRVLDAVQARRCVLEAYPRSSFALGVHDLALSLLRENEGRMSLERPAAG
ncbi:MAG: ATP-binding protein [Desulfuromonas sp.]|nr:MAG: ATP-binding protein [Desulfuromonas sp.]